MSESADTRPLVESVVAAARAHPGMRLAQKQIRFGGAFLGLAMLFMVLGVPAVGTSLGVMGLLYLWLARLLRRDIPTLGIINRAFDDSMRGFSKQALALYAEADARVRLRGRRRTVAIGSAVTHLRDGEIDLAIEQATLAIDTPLGWEMGAHDPVQVQTAHAYRAFALASKGDIQGARRDAELATAPKYASQPALTYAALALALASAKENRKDDVRETLDRERAFLDELGPRERALVRALEKFSAASNRSAYRHPSPPEERDPIDVWQDAASPAPAELRGLGAPITDEARQRVALPAAKWSIPAQRKRTLVAWLLMMSLFVAVWEALVSGDPHLPTMPWGAWTGWAASGLFLAAFGGALAANVFVHQPRLYLERLHATVALRRGALDAIARLQRLAKRGIADAFLELARDAERRRDFEGALKFAEQGITRANATPVTTYDLAAPGLAAERAFCLAALGRSDDANAALAAAPNSLTYAYAGLSHFRVRLAQALTRGDTKAAYEIAQQRGHLPLSARDELLVDVLRAMHGDIDEEERDRIQRVRAQDAELAAWVDHFLPPSNQTRTRVHEDDEAQGEEEVGRMRGSRA